MPYHRPKDSHPVVPEELEAGSFSGYGAFEYLSALEFSSDGKTLVGSVLFDWHAHGDKKEIKIKENHLIAWDASTGKVLWKTKGPANEINRIAYSVDGKTLIVVDQAGVGFWDAGKGRELRRWESRDPLFSACFSPDHLWLATGSKDEVLLWEVATGKVVKRLALPGKEIKAIAFSSDGKLLAGGGEKSIRIWDVSSGKVEGDCAESAKPIEAVAFSTDGKTLFSGHREENVLRRWEVASRKQSGEMTGSLMPIRVLSFSADSTRILTSSTGSDFYLWESATGKSCPLPRKDDPRFVNEWLGSSGKGALLRCEDSLGMQVAMMLTGRVDRLDRLPGFIGSSVDGQRMLLQSEKDNMPCLTVVKVPTDKVDDKDKQENKVEREIVWKEGKELSAALSPDGKTVAIAGRNIVCFVDVGTRQERRYAHSTDVKEVILFRAQSVKFSADGSRIALLGGDDRIRVLAVKDGRRLAEIATKSRGITGLAFSPDGQTLLTTTMGGQISIWEVATGQLVRRLENGIYLFSYDNRLLAGQAENINVIDLYSGRIIRTCSSEGHGFGNFAFSPNNQWLAGSCSDTTVVVWPTSAVASGAVKSWGEKGLAQILETGSATEAYAALGRIVDDPENALPFLERRLRAAPRADAERVRRLIDDLDNNEADRREAALKDLAELGTLAEPALKTALSVGKLSAGSRERIEKLVRELETREAAHSAEDVLHIRAIQALERIGSKRARRLLETLARGAELNPRTRAATDALGRMDAR